MRDQSTELAGTMGPYHFNWHNSGDGWLKVQRYVEIEQIAEDVAEVHDLELTLISPQ